MAAPNVPAGGGPTRAYHLLHALCDVADVTLVSLGSFSGGGSVSQGLASRCARLIEPRQTAAPTALKRKSRLRSWLQFAVVLAAPQRNHWLDFFHQYLQHGMPNLKLEVVPGVAGRILRTWWRNLSVFSDMPPVQTMFLASRWKTCEPEVLALLENREVDVLWCEESLGYWFLQNLHNRFSSLPLVVSAHNVEYVLRQRLKDTAEHETGAAYWESQVNCCRRLERTIFSRAIMTIMCSDADAEIGRRFCPDGKFAVIGNGVDTHYFRRSDATARQSQPIVLFTGGFGYDPNSNAVVHFCKHILPLIRRQVPDCKFIFAGREAERVLKQLDSRDALIDAVDSPADMRPIFEMAAVFVVPLLSGGGTRLKILEAMSMQLPVVSTTIGAEGLGCQPGEHLLIADSHQEFAHSVISLLRDPQQRRLLGDNARAWVCTSMDWNIHRKNLKNLLCGNASFMAGTVEP